MSASISHTQGVCSAPSSLCRLKHIRPRSLRKLSLHSGVRLVRFTPVCASDFCGKAFDQCNTRMRVRMQAKDEKNVDSEQPVAQLRKASFLIIDFDNETNEKVTIMTVSVNDPNLLPLLTSALTTLSLIVVSANVAHQENGKYHYTFHLTDERGDKVLDSSLGSIRADIDRLCTISSRSSKPAIFGQAVEEETNKLQPLRVSLEADASLLKRTSEEMSNTATHLVEIEMEIMTLLKKEVVDDEAIFALEAKRAEAASHLERRLAAMAALMTARRTPVREATPQAARGPGADLKFMAGGGTSSGPAAGNGFEIILQAFNWESWREEWYKTLMSKAQEMSAIGITSLWLPPPSDAVSEQGYLPKDYYNLQSKYGSEADLRSCIQTLHEHQLKVVADVVINHRCAHNQDERGLWNKFGGRLPWDASAICSNNPSFGGTGNPKNGEDYLAAPNIDHSQKKIREDITNWLKWMRSSVGFDGWRFDFVKGYDYSQQRHRQRIIDWCDRTGGTAAAFDFTTKGILQEAMGRTEYWRLVDAEGRPPGLLGLWPSRAITFIENHDTGSTLNHWPFPSYHLHEGYAYILTHPGTPCIFWDHFWAGGGLAESIRALIQVRKKHKIHNRSKVTVLKAHADLYAAVIDGKIAVKMVEMDQAANAAMNLRQLDVPVEALINILSTARTQL